MGSWKVGRRSTFLSKTCVQQRSSFLAQWVKVNKQNCIFWRENQPKELQKLAMHSEKVTVWCGLWAGYSIGPYFFKDAANLNVTVYGERYREMIVNVSCSRGKSLTFMTCGFNKMVPHATQHANNGLNERRVRQLAA